MDESEKLVCGELMFYVNGKKVCWSVCVFVTFCVSRRRRKMYCFHARLCVCLSVCLSVSLSAAVRPHYCTDPDVTWGHGRGCPLVVHYCADLQSGTGCVAMAT